MELNMQARHLKMLACNRSHFECHLR